MGNLLKIRKIQKIWRMTSAIHKQQSHGNFRWKNVDEKNSFDLVLNYWQSLMGSLHKGFGKIQANLKILDQY